MIIYELITKMKIRGVSDCFVGIGSTHCESIRARIKINIAFSRGGRKSVLFLGVDSKFSNFISRPRAEPN